VKAYCPAYRFQHIEQIYIVDALDAIPPVDSKVPTVIIGETTKGKGVSFMENQPKWHSGKLSDEQYEEAIAQLKKAYGREN